MSLVTYNHYVVNMCQNLVKKYGKLNFQCLIQKTANRNKSKLTTTTKKDPKKQEKPKLLTHYEGLSLKLKPDLNL